MPPRRLRNSRRRIIRTQAQDEHCIDSNDFDRAETGIKTIAAVHSQCRFARITAPQHSPQLAESIRAAKRFWVMGLNRSRGRSLRQAAG
jgi:hypothetical protein